MTTREIPRSQLASTLPELLDAATVAVVVSPEEDTKLPLVWEAARAVARSGRRVLVVDLGLERPALVPPVPPEIPEGIVDAFLFGASLTHVTREQDVPGLFFIGVGTSPADPDEVWTSDRWLRLARGFEQEGALLLVFAPRRAITRLAVKPSVYITLRSEDARDVQHLVERDRALLLSVVRDPPPPRTRRTTGAVLAAMIEGHFTGPMRRLRGAFSERQRELWSGARWAMGAAALVAVAVLAVLLAGGDDSGRASASQPAVEPPSGPPPAQPAPTTTVAADTLFYSLQVAAFKAPAQALEASEDYAARGWTPTIVPVRLGRQGVWYRLLVGAFAEPAGADQQRRAAWDARLLTQPNGTILRTPHALLVGEYPDSLRAAGELSALRERGVLGYIVESPAGSWRVLVGAFESPEQAGLADSILSAAGRSGTLVRRTGTPR